MTLDEFLDWCPADGRRWELVDGTPQVRGPETAGRGRLHFETMRQIGNHLIAQRGDLCVTGMVGVLPPVLGQMNFRVPDGAVVPRGLPDGYLTDAAVIVDLLSPDTAAATWRNVWTWITLPGLREILVLYAEEVRAEILRRDERGHWPHESIIVTDGDLTLDFIGFRTPLVSLYRTTGLAASAE